MCIRDRCDSVAERPACSLSTSTSYQQDTCVSEACGNGNNVSGLVSEFSDNSETISPGCSDKCSFTKRVFIIT